MGTARRARYAKEKRDPGGFVALANMVLRSEQFAALTPHANKLLLDLLAQYNGNNNGDLCATWSMMEKRGWRSRDTLAKALRELQAAGFVAQTRQGGRHAPSLYGLTFYGLDENPKLDVRGAEFPRGSWARAAAGCGLTRHNRCHAGRVNSKPTTTPSVSPALAEAIN